MRLTKLHRQTAASMTKTLDRLAGLTESSAVRDRSGPHRPAWDEQVLPALSDYTRIPCLSPAFDPEWAEHGHITAAAHSCGQWVDGQGAELPTEIVQLPGRTPVLLVDNGPPGDPIVIYGHMDKQPPLGEWRAGFSPYEPVREGDLLYGRGTADDGYSTFAAVTGLVAAGGGHGRVLVLIEASEESGSPDLPAYLEHLGERIGRRPRHLPRLGRAQLRPPLAHHVAARQPRGPVTCDVLTEGIHSGQGEVWCPRRSASCAASSPP